MNTMIKKYSMGIGDRFAKQGISQLAAFKKAMGQGVEVTPVWNKSFREHQTVGSKPDSVRKEADDSVAELSWTDNYLVDADHITLSTVDDFIPHSDFFTIDVANQIGLPLEESEINNFLDEYQFLVGEVTIPGIDALFKITHNDLMRLGNKFHHAIKEANLIYQKIKKSKDGGFVVEISMDEVDEPQTPIELYFILVLLSKAEIPVCTIAPKFSGRFNKGVDYKGDIVAFEKEFEEDLLVIAHCVKTLGLPADLKLSIHTGSDKFSLYPIMNRLIKKHDCGLHLKTAGTTWLEELIGLAESEGTGLEMAKSIYQEAYGRFDELTVPYANVIEVDQSKLPKPEEVNLWNGKLFADVLRHDQSKEAYNLNFRQLLHTGYKLAAERGESFIKELDKNSEQIGKNVLENTFSRHLKPLFL